MLGTQPRALQEQKALLTTETSLRPLDLFVCLLLRWHLVVLLRLTSYSKSWLCLPGTGTTVHLAFVHLVER